MTNQHFVVSTGGKAKGKNTKSVKIAAEMDSQHTDHYKHQWASGIS